MRAWHDASLDHDEQHADDHDVDGFLNEYGGRTEGPNPGKRTRAWERGLAVLRRAEANAIVSEDEARRRIARAAATSGAPLPVELRARFERSLGADLSAVRVHTGPEAAAAARSLRARAFALGNDVYFADGAYDPSSRAGVELLAHEVAHTVQQPSAPSTFRVSQPGDALERQADAAAQAMISGRAAVVDRGVPSTAIHRDPGDDAAVCETPTAWVPSRVEDAREEIGDPPCKTLGGAPIRLNDRREYSVRIGGRTYGIKISESNRFFGIVYGGRPELTETMIDELVASRDPSYLDDRDRHVAAGARAHVRSEGSVSSLNTWDTQFLTIAGRGWASGNAQQLLDIAESEARRLGRTLDLTSVRARCAELGAPSTQGTAGPRFNMNTITALAGELEDRDTHRWLALAFLRHSMRVFYTEDRREPTDADRARLQEGLDAGLDDVVIGIATHFELGMPGYFPNPMEVAIQANQLYPQRADVRAAQGWDFEQLSRQVAYLMRVRAAGYVRNNGHSMRAQAYDAVTTQKMGDFDRHFQHLVADTGGETGGHASRRRPNPRAGHDGRVFFRAAAAAEVCPALAGPTSGRPPEGHVWVDVTGRGRRDFGPEPGGAATEPEAATEAAVQPKSDRSPARPAADVRDAAVRGVSSASDPLPHADRIQASFGSRHDVSSIRAHVGGAAVEACRDIDARAYAMGNDVAFASYPDLRTAAHEAAHVIQQARGVNLYGGVGQAGDPYERHADAVAELVVAGRSAAPLFDELAGGASSPSVQRIPGECDPEAAPDAAMCDPEGETESEAAEVDRIREALPELAEREPALREGASPADRARERYRIPSRGWTHHSGYHGHDVTLNLAGSLPRLIERVREDPEALAHIRRTLDLFYTSEDERSRLRPGDIDLPLVLAIANRESAGHFEMLLSGSDTPRVTGGPDTITGGDGGLDYAGDRRALFPSAIRDEVLPAQSTPRLRARLRRPQANPAEMPERDLLAAYIVEVRARTERFERLFTDRVDDFLTAEQIRILLGAMTTDARRAWIQASFGSALPTLLSEAVRRLRRAVGERSFEDVLADDQVNLNSIVTDDRIMDRAGLSGHRTRITAAEAWMVEQGLPPEILHYAGPPGSDVAECAPPEAPVCE